MKKLVFILKFSAIVVVITILEIRLLHLVKVDNYLTVSLIHFFEIVLNTKSPASLPSITYPIIIPFIALVFSTPEIELEEQMKISIKGIAVIVLIQAILFFLVLLFHITSSLGLMAIVARIALPVLIWIGFMHERLLRQ